MADHAENILKSILFYLNISYHPQWHKEHQEHVDYPSFISFHYLLKKQGINSIAIKSDMNHLPQLPLPLLIHTRKEKFALIVKIEDDHIHLVEGPKNKQTLSKPDLESIWDGNVLIFDKNNIRPEKRSWQTRPQKLFSNHKAFIAMMSGLFLLIGILLYKPRSTYNLLYLFYSLAGIFISTLYMIRQTNRNNTFIQKFCPATKKDKIDCSAILDTKAAYFRGLFAWSDFSLIYFSTLLTVLLFFPDQPTIRFISIPVLLASGYVFYSLYYQIFIARKWCILCLMMMPVLLAGGITSVFFLQSETLQISFSFSCVFSLLIAILYTCCYSMIFAFYKKNTHYKIVKRKYQTLKFQPEIMQCLFQKQPHIDTSQLETLCLTPRHKNGLTVVFNPTCGPCLYKLHYLLRLIAGKDQTQLELILFTDPDKNSDSYLAAQYLTRLYLASPSDFHQVLHHYISGYPDLIKTQTTDTLSDHPLSDQLISVHREWCIQNHISATPLIFFNHTLLPSEYTLEDLDYMCL